MRDGRGRQARLPALPAPDGASARTETVAGAPVPAGPCGICGAGLSGGALFCAAAVASEYAGAASEFRRRCAYDRLRPGKTMSEAAVAPVRCATSDAWCLRARRRNRLNPLEALERGFALFRSTFAREAWRYYAGAAPLVLCFIPMWVVDGQIRISNGVLLHGGDAAGRGVSAALMGGRPLHARVRERAFGVPASKPAGASRASCSGGAAARVENHSERRRFGWRCQPWPGRLGSTARANSLVLRRGRTPPSAIHLAAVWRLRANGSAAGCFFF